MILSKLKRNCLHYFDTFWKDDQFINSNIRVSMDSVKCIKGQHIICKRVQAGFLICSYLTCYLFCQHSNTDQSIGNKIMLECAIESDSNLVDIISSDYFKQYF